MWILAAITHHSQSPPPLPLPLPPSPPPQVYLPSAAYGVQVPVHFYIPATLCHFYPSISLRMAVRTVKIASWKGIYCNASPYVQSVIYMYSVEQMGETVLQHGQKTLNPVIWTCMVIWLFIMIIRIVLGCGGRYISTNQGSICMSYWVKYDIKCSIWYIFLHGCICVDAVYMISQIAEMYSKGDEWKYTTAVRNSCNQICKATEKLTKRYVKTVDELYLCMYMYMYMCVFLINFIFKITLGARRQDHAWGKETRSWGKEARSWRKEHGLDHGARGKTMA